MLEFDKMIFNDEYVVFNDTETNKKGIATTFGNIVLEAKYDHIFNSTGDWAIVANKQTIHNMEVMYFGIIDSRLKEMITPVYNAYEEMEKIITRLNENKYGIPDIQVKMTKILQKQTKEK